MTVELLSRRETEIVLTKRRIEQIIEREGETATLLSRCVVSFSLRGGGFAPRQLNRWVLCGKFNATSK